MSENQILLYETDGGETRVEVLYEGETVWLSQRDMAQLFQVTVQNINSHIKSIYNTGELSIDSTLKKFFKVQTEGNRRVSRETIHYNLDMIISVGYRVNSYRGTQFRIWATQNLTEFIRKGFVLDDDRLAHGGSRYFDELQKRVRDIRTSEYNLYSKVRDIFAMSYDYSAKSAEAKQFFAIVQNKFHYAIHGHTATELIVERVDSRKPNMGMTNWRSDKISLKDAVIAKNYLTSLELEGLNLLVDQFLSFAEFQALRKQVMYMSDWGRKLDQFIGELNELPVLDDAGTVSRKSMTNKVKKVLERFRQRLIAEQSLSEDEFEEQLEAARVSLSAKDEGQP